MVHIGAVDPSSRTWNSEPVEFARRTQVLEHCKHCQRSAVDHKGGRRDAEIASAAEALHNQKAGQSIRSVKQYSRECRVAVSGDAGQHLNANEGQKRKHRQKDRIPNNTDLSVTSLT